MGPLLGSIFGEQVESLILADPLGGSSFVEFRPKFPLIFFFLLFGCPAMEEEKICQ